MTQSVYLRGQPIYVVKRFYSVDPVDGSGALEDPDAVTFEVIDPNNDTTSYVWHVDAEVTNASVGVFVLSLPPLSPVGAYKARCSSSGTGLIDAEEFAFDVIESGVLPPDPPRVAVSGPCSAWINGDDVAACGPDLGVGSETWRLDDCAYDASALLYELTMRRFPGVCTRTVRPCQSGCSHFGNWGGAWGGSGAWFWGAVGYNQGGGWGVGPAWVNDYSGLSCGCGTDSYVRLAGYPVREIEEVKIDGVVLPEFNAGTGAREWRLDDRTNLTRMWAPGGDNPTPQWWPSCQNLSLDDDQPGTFSIKYTWGEDVPALGRQAAAQLARELWAACTGGTCRLPTKVTKVVRQGITVERITPLATMLRQGATGLQIVDAFIAQTNPGGARRRPAIFTPDDQQYAREVGQ
jgi:hypothetical protein